MENDTMNRTWDSGNGGSSSMVDTARHQVQEKAGQWIDQARGQVVSQLDSQMDRAAGSVGSMAQAFRQAGQQLRGQDQEMFASYLEGAADYVERFSGYLKEQDVRRMVDEVEGFARREPGLFLGGAFALGFLAARFLKSSSPNVTQNNVYGTADYAGAVGRREYASSGPFTGPAHDRAAMGDVKRSETDYATSSSQGLADTAASGMAGIGAATAPGAASSMSTSPAATTPGTALTEDVEAEDEEYASTAGTSPSMRSSDGQ